jgi:F0F1-type ATP synthase membrane subunit a
LILLLFLYIASDGISLGCLFFLLKIIHRRKAIWKESTSPWSYSVCLAIYVVACITSQSNWVWQT